MPKLAMMDSSQGTARNRIGKVNSDACGKLRGIVMGRSIQLDGELVAPDPRQHVRRTRRSPQQDAKNA
jgi:hypothetical protein